MGDLDACWQNDGGTAAHTIGVRPSPVPSIREEKISKLADIVIFTGRISGDTGDKDSVPSLSAGQIRIRIIDWLEKHKFPFADVYIGQGKPRVAAFIDDRAVHCSPQHDAEAYANAETALRALLKRKSAKVTVPEKKFNLHRGKTEIIQTFSVFRSRLFFRKKIV